MLTGNDIDAWLAEWAVVWGARDLAERVRVEPGRRLRSSLGRCQPALGLVRIHPALFEAENAELFREVVCHEAAHVAAYLIHGRGIRPHGREWKGLVVAAGYPARARMDPRRLSGGVQEALRPKKLYRHRCLDCGAVRMARRRCSSWRCRGCWDAGLPGELEVVSVQVPRT